MVPFRVARSLLIVIVLLQLAMVPVACGDASSAGDDVAADAAAAADVVDVGGQPGDASGVDAADAGSHPGDASEADIGTWPQYAEEFTVVEIEAGISAPLRLAVAACAGLYNRRSGGSVYIQAEDKDARWLEELDLTPAETVGAAAFLEGCVAEFPSCVRYSYTDQQRLLPNILTVGAALGAVPLDVGMAASCGEVAFDATVELEESNTPELATRYVSERYLDQTTGLAMLNPGYDIHASDLSRPDITRDMPSALVDFVFAKKLFVVFLINGCVASSPENEVFQNLVNDAPWTRPIGVYGYNNSWLIGGYLYEAQTRCLESRNMGAIPTETSNLSFFATRRPPITDASELEGNAPEGIEYDPTKTYVAFVVGDGDNVQFIMATRNVWLQQRLDDCEKPDNSCAPLTWSISPHLPSIAPDVLEWYYEKSRQTGKDYFILPPSGHLYAYPTSLAEGDQDRFVAATEEDARILGLQSTVHWEVSETWEEAEEHFLPKYARQDGAIRGVFPVNVPFMFPTFTWWDPDWFFRVLTGDDGGEVAVFRPRQWRGVDGSGSGMSEPFYLTPEQMAEELGGYPAGTVTWVYMTSDGGLSLENSFMELVKILPDHVVLVSADTAAEMALAADRR